MTATIVEIGIDVDALRGQLLELPERLLGLLASELECPSLDLVIVDRIPTRLTGGPDKLLVGVNFRFPRHPESRPAA